MTTDIEQLTLPLGQRSQSGRLPCPFCGGIDLSLVTFGPDNRPLLIQCNRCGTTGPTHNAVSEAELAALWDVRAKTI